MTNWFYYLGKIVTGFIFRIWFHMEFYGQENQPRDRGYILCCNHRSALDPVLIAQKIKKPIRYMAKIELFQNKFVSFIIRRLGAFPVARGRGDTSAIDTAVETVKKGHVLGLFPEGTDPMTISCCVSNPALRLLRPRVEATCFPQRSGTEARDFGPGL